MEKIPQEEEKSEKEIAWEQGRAEVDKIADKLGLGVDERIKEAIAAFRIHGFATSASCGGHMGELNEEGKRHGLPYPWIDLYAPEPKGWKENEENKKEWTIENFTQQRKMMNFLEDFYKDRDTTFDARLTFKGIGVFGGFRIQSFGADMMVLLTPEEQAQKLGLYLKEMDDFTNFLKGKYLDNKDS